MAKSKKSEIWSWIKALLIAVAIAFIVRTFLFAPIVVDGPSMEPTLHDRDQMIVNKLIYHLQDPERFDIIVFHFSNQKDFIKRVIGLPGETVKVKDDELYINDEKVDEPFLEERQENNTLQPLTSDFTMEDIPDSPEVIPEDKLLVLGDNRRNSTDSRVIGLIPTDQVVGRASVIYWPFNRMQFLH